MDIETLLIFLGLPSIVTGAIVGFGVWLIQRRIIKSNEEQREQNRLREQREEERDKARETSQYLMVEYLDALTSLNEATAKAVRDKECNGEMEAALKYTKDVKHKFRKFMNEQGIKHLC